MGYLQHASDYAQTLPSELQAPVFVLLCLWPVIAIVGCLVTLLCIVGK